MTMEFLTKEQITDKLESMVVGENGVYAQKCFAFIVKNPEYNPTEFSKEIEESEVEINEIQVLSDFAKNHPRDWIFRGEIEELPRNSEVWLHNHTKICELKFLPFHIFGCAAENYKGVRNYNSPENVEKIWNISEKYGGIIDFC